MTKSISQTDIQEFIAIRRDIHMHPETAYEEFRTSELVANKLREYGLEVTTGLAGTGVVGSLYRGEGPCIGLRSDMDALHINELNTFDYKSRHQGKMHACGHDGHTAMLLGAAKQLSATDTFNGTVHFIFQPAEENERGAKTMIEDGLFEKFDVDYVYGMHNWPELPAGKFAVCSGSIMGAFELFEITLSGKGAHAAMPHQGTDIIVVASQLVTAMQSIVSRSIDPQHAAVLSVTQIHSGDTWNVLPEEAVIKGGMRYFYEQDRDILRGRLEKLTTNIATAFDVKSSIEYKNHYPAVINETVATEKAISAASKIVGQDNVET
ncbi:MAG: amidohydrolase, partial [Pseudomonadota bacterium]